MDDLIKKLEGQIKTLISKHQEIQSFNENLHQTKFQLAKEKDLLLAKQQRAINQIEMLVNKLKAFEKLT